MCDNVLYVMLGVKSTANLKEIKEAYKFEVIKRDCIECQKNGCLKELDYAFEVLTDPTIYKIEFNNKYDQNEVFDATRREIYDSEGLTGLEFFSQNSTSFVEKITEKGIVEMHYVEGFYHIKLNEGIINCCLNYCLDSEKSLENKDEKALDLSKYGSGNETPEPTQRNQLPQKKNRYLLFKSKNIESKNEELHPLRNNPNKLKIIDARYRCSYPYCDYVPTRKRALKGHIKTVHLKQYDYKCDWPDCGKSYAANRSLKDHINIHTGVKPYNCERQNCKKSFFSFNSLKYHLKNSHY